MTTQSPDSAANAPGFLDLVPPPASEDRAPVAANFVNVHGEGDMFALDFFYVHPSKVSRIFDGAPLGEGSVRSGDTVIHTSEPVARLVLPLTTVTELVTELVERIGSGVPHLRSVLEDFGDKLHVLSHMAGSGFEDEHDEEGDEGDDDEAESGEH